MPKKKPRFKFSISSEDPHLHYFQVSLSVSLKTKKIGFSLPSWTPGSYLIRDFAGHLHLFEAYTVSGKKIKWEQTSNDSWIIFPQNQNFLIRYKIYAFEHSVRTNFLDTEYGFISPPALFLYPTEMLNEESEIEFRTRKHFKNVFTALKKKANTRDTFISENFDQLYDSPIQISNKNSSFFTIGNCLHELIIEGDSANIEESITNDLQKITGFEIDMMGNSPNTNYLFILNLTDSSYGGLEHSASSVNIFDPLKLTNKDEYLKLLGLLAHEYFHLWNVKRIRPIALGPFNYQSPNLTKELWVAEGITSFYDNYILLQTGFFSVDKYLSEIATDIQTLMNSTGEEWMSLEESSLTAWTKYYKQQPNSHNTGISYYVKGALLVLCMDITIRKKTSGKNNFLNILKLLYSDFYLSKNRGFTKEEFFRTAKKATGVDLSKEFEIHLTERKRLPVTKYLRFIGVESIESERGIDLGFSVKEENGKHTINKIFSQKISGKTDINLNDELIAIDGKRLTKENYPNIRNSMRGGKISKLLLSRKGRIIERNIRCEISVLSIKLALKENPTPDELNLRENFLKGKKYAATN